ncbi:MAG: flagellar protein export ATPase FliI [Armatimonadetes bacterium]|nr:flagellar protein export ATPase FliI [Armatimonadota bacterium]NIM24376.1 flagellar protein export ATPase FliI [Armatimonadota bacterium]NIM68245.1 flagellar protein export ATPase FliI [Armatimonadota bacterium]NIM75146.1 flagellar protein export ATPase FliI [Armatimonadota bacterium]NIN06450.1 flagellar protein export ATPase FliI [Armatimonadota bacterium]
MGKPAGPSDLSKYRWLVSRTDSLRLNGNVCQVVGVVVESVGPGSRIGEVCKIEVGRNKAPIPAEVVGFRDNRVLLMPLGDMGDIAHGNEVVATGHCLTVSVGQELLGRVLDGLGRPIDGKGSIIGEEEYPVYQSPPHPLERKRITEPLTFGVRAIDGLLTCGRGQRMGIFSGSGVGKSTLLGMIARNSEADVNVIALIGERGREVREFIEGNLGEEGMKRSVVVVATSDQPSLQRLKGALVATTIAEYFRDQGCNVMFMMDSITRFAWAQREIGLAIGEPPTARGYTPSVFAILPRLLERTGSGKRGTITGLYTILVEGDDMNEPVADTVRGILDGHIVLSRELASKAHYPAIDVLHSVSRLMPDITKSEHQKAAQRMRKILSVYAEAEDLINIGAYSPGSNRDIDEACSLIDEARAFLIQTPDEVGRWGDVISRLCELEAVKT